MLRRGYSGFLLSSGSPTTIRSSHLHDNRALVARFLEKFTANTLDEAFSMIADNGTWIIPGQSPIARRMTKDEFRTQVSGLLDLMPTGFLIRPTAWTIDGDRVAVEAVSEGTVVNGKAYSNQYHLLFEIYGEQIKSVTEYACSFHVLDVFREFLGG